MKKFLTIERANKTDTNISTARKQNGLCTIGVRHDGFHPVCKVLVRHVMGYFQARSILAFLLCIVIVL